MKKRLQKKGIILTVLSIALVLNSCISYQGTTRREVVRYDYSYNNPTWAPPYYAGARYYYFPDIEVYYDLSASTFIMLNSGRWLNVQTIAPFYSGFDLYNSYIVVLNVNVYQPWMHHHYYVKHYPRYYYIDYYDYSNIPYVRGYNENKKGAIFWGSQDLHRARPWDSRNIQENRKFNYSSADRKVQLETTRRVNQERSTAASRATASTSASRTDAARTSTSTRETGATRTTTTTPRSSTTTATATRETTTATRTNATTSTTTRETTATRSGTAAARSNIQSSIPGGTEVQDRGTSTNYYGNTIGNPVRVESQMRRSDTGSRASTSTRSTATDRSSSTQSSNTRSSGR